MPIRHFRDLDVWKRATALTFEIFRCTEGFPSRVRFGLAEQMRRSATSIGGNIAEGFGRRPLRDKARFYNIAEGSAYELENYLYVSQGLGYLKEISGLTESLHAIGQMLVRLVDRTMEAAESDDRFGYRSRRPRP